MMRQINCSIITKALEEAILKAVTVLPDDVLEGIQRARNEEECELSRQLLDILLENARIAKSHRIALCQDTGMLCAYVFLGQDVHITGGSLRDAIDRAVAKAYTLAPFRKSVCSPLSRAISPDNSPAIVDFEVVTGDSLRILVIPKGGGCENMSRTTILKPMAGVEGVKEFVMDCVLKAGSAPCPPYVLGVGIGGNLELCAKLSKLALYADISQTNPDSQLSCLEAELKERINALGIGVAGSSGSVTCMRVRIEAAPTHITSLPVAVSFGCNSLRKIEVTV